ncbi:MAG: hypothetical protein J7604_25155 [Sporocytophaga sp.]|uniref:hypothetical protein n=1 Tax=Sporocytophaga sp. TaxID=2231183 RepID=UPI001B223CBA|nr:hypothetical protein [Sporocytophaga sp.]MBO9703521.1 hypothetical protein [Sporocytophaga sp.]
MALVRYFIKESLPGALILLLFLLVSCKKEYVESAPAWNIVKGEYKGLLYKEKPKDSLGIAQAYYDQDIKVSKVGADEYRLTPSNPDLPTFNFIYDSKTSMTIGVIYDEYYYTINTQTNNGVTVTSKNLHLVYDRKNSGIDFHIYNGTGDIGWLYGGKKQ